MPEEKMNSEKQINFEVAFGGTGGSVRICECGKTFYNSDGGWDWEDGELERLEKNDAIDLDHAVGDLFFNGTMYVDACDCWHAKAERLMGWIDDNAHRIAHYLNSEKKREQAEADSMPVVEVQDTKIGDHTVTVSELIPAPFRLSDSRVRGG